MEGHRAGEEAGRRLDAAHAAVCRLAPLLPTLIPGFGDTRNFMLLEMSQLGATAPQELAASVWSGLLVRECNAASSSVSYVYLPSAFCLVTEGPHSQPAMVCENNGSVRNELFSLLSLVQGEGHTGRLCCYVFEAQFSILSVCVTDRQAGVCEGHAKGGQTPSFVSLVTHPLETLVHKVGAQWTGL